MLSWHESAGMSWFFTGTFKWHSFGVVIFIIWFSLSLAPHPCPLLAHSHTRTHTLSLILLFIHSRRRLLVEVEASGRFGFSLIPALVSFLSQVHGEEDVFHFVMKPA